jgi:hypothetical protein
LCAEALQRAGAEKVCFEKYNFKGDLTGMKGIQGITSKAKATIFWVKNKKTALGIEDFIPFIPFIPVR